MGDLRYVCPVVPATWCLAQTPPLQPLDPIACGPFTPHRPWIEAAPEQRSLVAQRPASPIPSVLWCSLLPFPAVPALWSAWYPNPRVSSFFLVTWLWKPESWPQAHFPWLGPNFPSPHLQTGPNDDHFIGLVQRLKGVLTAAIAQWQLDQGQWTSIDFPSFCLVVVPAFTENSSFRSLHSFSLPVIPQDYIPFSGFIHSPTKGHLGCIWALGTMTKITVNISCT